MGPHPRKPTERDRAEVRPDKGGEQERDPHHGLANPADAPDPTEWPDPYDRRDDPRDPEDPDHAPFGDEPHVPPGRTSTSEPHPSQDPEAPDWEGPKRDKLDQ